MSEENRPPADPEEFIAENIEFSFVAETITSMPSPEVIEKRELLVREPEAVEPPTFFDFSPAPETVKRKANVDPKSRRSMTRRKNLPRKQRKVAVKTRKSTKKQRGRGSKPGSTSKRPKAVNRTKSSRGASRPARPSKLKTGARSVKRNVKKTSRRRKLGKKGKRR